MKWINKKCCEDERNTASWSKKVKIFAVCNEKKWWNFYFSFFFFLHFKPISEWKKEHSASLQLWQLRFIPRVFQGRMNSAPSGPLSSILPTRCRHFTSRSRSMPYCHSIPPFCSFSFLENFDYITFFGRRLPLVSFYSIILEWVIVFVSILRISSQLFHFEVINRLYIVCYCSLSLSNFVPIANRPFEIWMSPSNLLFVPAASTCDDNRI